MFRVFLLANLILPQHSLRDDEAQQLHGVSSLSFSDELHYGILNGTRSPVKEAWFEAKSRLDRVRPLVMQHMVFHRGFHSFTEVPDLPLSVTKRRPLTRPIENTVAAFSAVWEMGADLCECDVALTKDKQLVLSHDDTIERFRDGAKGLPTLKEQTLAQWQQENLVGIDEFMKAPAPTGSEKTWVQIPTLADVLEAASKLGSAKKLVVEVKADESTAFETGKAVAAWVKQNPVLAKHIAVVMSFAESALDGYHQEDTQHGPGEDDLTLMLLTVKRESVKGIYQENPVKCDDGEHWTAASAWQKPAHLDGYYQEVTFKDQMQWLATVAGHCENRLGVALGAWTYPGDRIPLEQNEQTLQEYQTMNAADVEKSQFFLVDRMGFGYVNTDFPTDFGSEGYRTMMSRATHDARHVAVDMPWPSHS
eukprot:TRINITY_DN104158_c0_g1_i1.p1 TRINITY_DN104158_c0_g1~~TRINITY_DN104158_c0_g1_i1.p1  ORF type:complete len:421 (+),score=81.11 TRINITY_DN104158_c0_g1_i1:120-1382(+)